MIVIRDVLVLLFLFVIPGDVVAFQQRPGRQMSESVLPSFGADRDPPSRVLPFTLQECEEQPEIPHAEVRCGYSGCRVSCEKGYKIASADDFINLQCDHSSGRLTIDGQPWESQNLTCQPYCGVDGCYNGGLCKEPRKCECVNKYSGEHCELPPSPEEPLVTPENPETTCPDPDFPVINADTTRNGNQLLVRCKPGHVFTIGRTIAYIQCRDGVWDHPKGVFSPGGALVCEGTQCDPPCQNGGECLPEGVCDCPYKYWGSVCQILLCSYPDPSYLSNASLSGLQSRMKIQCHPGQKMRSGRRVQTILCYNGEWILSGRGPLKDNDVKCYPKNNMPPPV